ncbi:MAG: manganese efflux pump [Alicyclobacillus sp.]|nr:manganese efflux pump [Alicyclobacillus sp.]
MRDVAEICMMAVALGMDAFSLAIGVGLKGITRRRAWVVCLLIGLCHVVLTILGIYTGMLLQGVLGHLAKWLGAFLLFGLGLHMMYSSLFGSREDVRLADQALRLTLFSLSVSLDSLSVGFSLGLRSTAYGLVAALTFGVASCVLCGVGLGIGKRLGGWTGRFGEIFGACILLGYGVHFLVA